jgi:hypothetical protein
MRLHDSQSIEIGVPAERAFAYIAEASTLPEWTAAFTAVDGRTATLRTPRGEVEIGLTVKANEAHGTIDWFMTFPDGSVADAYSRIIPIGPDRCVYGFILTPPPVPLEALEGALDEQSRVLAGELTRLRTILEDQDHER